MPVLSAAPRTSTPDATVAAVVGAWRLVHADPVARELARTTTDEPDVEGALGRWLYTRWWSGLTEAPQPAGWPSAAPALEAARRRVATVDPGWLVLAVTDEALVAAALHDASPARRVRARLDAATASSRPGRTPRPGDLVGLVDGDSGVDPTGCWWWATTTRNVTLSGPLDRWYVHTPDLDAALSVLPAVLGAFIAAEVVASLKCPAAPELYGRRDALVVYVPRAAAPAAEAALLGIADRLTTWVAADVPPLTRGVLPGVATAQDPGGAVSYGQLRCAQVAAVVAGVDSALGPKAAALMFGGRLAALGLDPERPEVLA